MDADNPCVGSSVITRTWTLTDDCDNTTTDVQIITVQDITPPTFDAPEDVTIDCTADENDLTITGDVINEADNCDTSLGQATYTDSVDADNPCVGSSVITRTWTLTDDCDNTTTDIQIITVQDITPPTFDAPEDVIIDCTADENDLTITGDVTNEADNCDTSLGQATYTAVSYTHLTLPTILLV